MIIWREKGIEKNWRSLEDIWIHKQQHSRKYQIRRNQFGFFV